jgi:hypothetical protein
MASAPALKEIISKLCCVKKHSLGTASCPYHNPYPLPFVHPVPLLTTTVGRITLLVRSRDLAAEIASNLERNRRKQQKLEAKARAQAEKLENLNVAMETTLAASFVALTAEIRSFGRAKGVKLKYLQDQFKSRNIRMKGVYLSIPTSLEYRSNTKPYKLRMQPHPILACKPSTYAQIAYLLQLLELMMMEDSGRHALLTNVLADNTVVRRLPVVSDT